MMYSTAEQMLAKTRRRNYLLILLLVLTIALMGCAGNNVTPREGTVKGRILNLSGQPVEDALVSWSYDHTRWSLTDESGRFYIEAVGFGDQIFNVEAFGYRTRQFKTSIYSGQLSDADDITIEAKSFAYHEIKVVEVSATHAEISWKTTDYTNGLIQYGLTEDLGRTAREPEREYATSHSLRITGLQPEKQYFYKIVASREGRSAESSEILSFTTLSSLEDRTPPDAPGGVAAALTENPNQVTIFWAPGTDSDLKGYRVYRSELANAPFTQVSNSLIARGQERFVDVSVMPGKKYHYRVTAVDQAGNESGYNDVANILVPGDVSGTVTWTRANSPYIVMGDINVLPTGRINIDAGVEVLIEGSDSFRRNDQNRIDFIISGALVASAGNQLPVTFAANQSNPANNVWNGLHFKDTENPANTLVNVVISDASTGLTISNSKGTFNGVETLNCQTGVKISGCSEFKAENIHARRVTTGIELSNNTNVELLNSTVFHPINGLIANNNDGLKVYGCNFLEYTNTGLITNEQAGSIEFVNNLFASSLGTAIKILSQNPIFEYNTIDSPYAIQITQGNPIIRKNLIMAKRSVFGAGRKGIEHLSGTIPLPIFGPNNMTGFSAGSDYLDCSASADSTSNTVLLMKEINGEDFDYRLRQAYPNVEDPWGISRNHIPY